MDSIWNEIEGTIVKTHKLLKGLDENEDNYEAVKSRATNVINTAIAKEVCRFYK